jgi:hydroxyacyl-ACP dehydratase HTD2-like protein with hotdog domain
MDPKKWVGKSKESEFLLDPDIIQRVEGKLGRDGILIEKGDELKRYGHWFYTFEDNLFLDDLSGPEFENYSFYWHAGRIEYASSLILGNTYNRTVQIRDVKNIGGEEAGILITLGIKIRSGRKIAIEEEQTILFTDNIEEHQNLRRIGFEPDWIQEVNPEKINTLLNLNSRMFGNPVTDALTKANNKPVNGLEVQGSASMILLLDSFMYHFESRKVDRLTYKLHAYTDEEQLSIAGRDTDAFVTSMRLINSRRQVLCSLEVRWSYNW